MCGELSRRYLLTAGINMITFRDGRRYFVSHTPEPNKHCAIVPG